MPWLIPLLNAIAALPTLAGMLNKLIQTLMGWYIARQQADVLSAIADAASFSARAVTDEERYESAQKWRDALGKPRTRL